MANAARAALKQKAEFIANGAVFVPAEQRTYLRLKSGRGWVCERSRTDLRRWAVVPIIRRKKPLSKQRAKVIAFYGGDTGGVTKLKPQDLIKNKHGKIVSRKASEASRKRFADGGATSKWAEAVKRARAELGVEGFVALKKGTPFYERAQQYYKEAKLPSGQAG